MSDIDGLGYWPTYNPEEQEEGEFIDPSEDIIDKGEPRQISLAFEEVE